MLPKTDSIEELVKFWDRHGVTEFEDELEEITSQRFDSIIKKKQIEYEQMRERLEHLQKRVQESQAEIEKWKASKADKVKERMQELIRGTEKFQWD